MRRWATATGHVVVGDPTDSGAFWLITRDEELCGPFSETVAWWGHLAHRTTYLVEAGRWIERSRVRIVPGEPPERTDVVLADGLRELASDAAPAPASVEAELMRRRALLECGEPRSEETPGRPSLRAARRELVGRVTRDGDLICRAALDCLDALESVKPGYYHDVEPPVAVYCATLDREFCRLVPFVTLDPSRDQEVPPHEVAFGALPGAPESRRRLPVFAPPEVASPARLQLYHFWDSLGRLWRQLLQAADLHQISGSREPARAYLQAATLLESCEVLLFATLPTPPRLEPSRERLARRAEPASDRMWRCLHALGELGEAEPIWLYRLAPHLVQAAAVLLGREWDPAREDPIPADLQTGAPLFPVLPRCNELPGRHTTLVHALEDLWEHLLAEVRGGEVMRAERAKGVAGLVASCANAYRDELAAMQMELGAIGARPAGRPSSEAGGGMRSEEPGTSTRTWSLERPLPRLLVEARAHRGQGDAYPDGELEPEPPSLGRQPRLGVSGVFGYRFHYARGLEALCVELTDQGPWRWELREDESRDTHVFAVLLSDDPALSTAQIVRRDGVFSLSLSLQSCAPDALPRLLAARRRLVSEVLPAIGASALIEAESEE